MTRATSTRGAPAKRATATPMARNWSALSWSGTTPLMS
jgi:hypothetical protein